MAPKVTSICDIKPGLLQSDVAVRVMRLWNVMNNKKDPTEVTAIDMVLIDGQGGKIGATITRNYLKKFQLIVNEGNTYLIGNVLVASNNSKFRPTRHTHKIIFIDKTRVSNLSAPNIPAVTYHFTDFCDIINDGDDTWLIDVIGHVTERDEIKEINKDGRTHKLLDIGLQDLSGNKLKCTLWGKYADEMSLHIANHNSGGHVIVLMQLCMIKSFNGKSSISNAFHSTKLLINENTEEHREYREKLLRKAGTSSQPISNISSQRSGGNSDDLIQTKQMTIKEILNCKDECDVAFLAKVAEINTESTWWYPSCSKCFRKVQREDVDFNCGRCGPGVVAIPRYKVQILVFDNTECTSLVVFDKVFSQIIKKKAVEIVGDLHKDDFSDTVPDEFELLINKEYIFKIGITENNISKTWSHYTVKTMNGDLELIQKFRAMHSIEGFDDEDDQSNGPNTQQQDDNLDAFIDRDENATPISKSRGKRACNEDAVSTSPSDGTTQKSSTKAYKRIKTEKPSK